MTAIITVFAFLGINALLALVVPLLLPETSDNPKPSKVRWIKRSRVTLCIICLALIGISCLWGGLVPLKVLLTLTTLNMLFRENFPFSNYPMYYSFNPRPYYLKLVDQNGEQIALKRDLGLSADYIKRIYNNEAKEVARQRDCTVNDLTADAMRGPGNFTLDFMRRYLHSKQLNGDLSKISMYHVILSRRETTVEAQAFYVASIEV